MANSKLVRKFKQLLYRLGWVTPYSSISRSRYLRRLKNARFNDSRYLSQHDRAQFVSDEIVVKTEHKGGCSYFYCHPRSSIESLILNHGFFQQNVFDTLMAFAEPDSVALDIGANIGSYAIPLARAFPDIEVHGFEPNPVVIKRFSENIALNRLINRNIKVKPIALSDTPGRMNFYAVSTLEGNPGLSSFHEESLGNEQHQSIEIDVETLDCLYLDSSKHISVIKMDVQGHELQVLNGGLRMLEKFRPAIVFEHEDSLFSSTEAALNTKQQIAGLFNKLGYRCFYISRYGSDLLTSVKWDRPLNGDVLAIPFDQVA